MNEQPPKKSNLRIEHIKKVDSDNNKESGKISSPMEVVRNLLSGEISFPDEETQKKFEELKKARDQATSVEEREKIEFSIRQLLLS